MCSGSGTCSPLRAAGVLALALASARRGFSVLGFLPFAGIGTTRPMVITIEAKWSASRPMAIHQLPAFAAPPCKGLPMRIAGELFDYKYGPFSLSTANRIEAFYLACS